MERPSNGRVGCAALLLVVAAFILVPGIITMVRGEPTILDSWREARGGELLTTGGRASAGDMIRPAGEEWTRLIVGSLIALLGVVTLVRAIRDSRARKRGRRGGD